MSNRLAALALHASVWLSVWPGAASAVTFDWAGAGGTAAYADKGNWSPSGGPPDAGDNARFLDAGTHVVTIDPALPVDSDQLVISNGDYTFQSTTATEAEYSVSALFTSNPINNANVQVGETGLPVRLFLSSDLRVDLGSEVYVPPGSSIIGEDLFAGLTGGDNDILVAGAGSTLELSGSAVLGANGAEVDLRFFSGAAGVIDGDLTLINFSSTPGTQANLILNNDASVLLHGALGVGQSSSSTTGAQSSFVALENDSVLTQTGTNGVAIGIESSTNPSLSPRVTVTSGSTVNTGTGATLVRHNGILSLSSDNSVYNANGPVVISETGAVYVRFNGALNAAAGLDNSADGEIDHDAGTIRVEGGAFIPNSGGDYEVNGFDHAQYGDLRLVLGAGSTTNISGVFRFGKEEGAHLTVEGGAQLTTASATLSQTSGAGRVSAVVDGAGTLWDSGPLVANQADSDLALTDQAMMTSTSADLQTGLFTIAGGAHWAIGDMLAIDDLALVQVNNGGQLTTGTAVLGGGLVSSGGRAASLGVSGGQWHNTGDLWIGGGTTAGAHEAKVIVATNGDAQVDGTTTVWELGTLQIFGGALDLNGQLVDEGGVVDFGQGQLNLNSPANQLIVDLTGLKVDTIDLNAPLINGPRGISVAGNTIVTPGATFTILGGDAQLARLVVSSGGTVDYATGTFGTSGPLQAATGSVLDLAGGDVVLGDATAVNGVYIGGELHAHGNTVTLNDANDAVLDSAALATLAGGQIVAANGLTLDFGGNITGQGDVTTPNDPAKPLINNGHITGDSVGQPITLSGYVKGVGVLENVVITGTDAPGFSPAAVSRGSVSYEGVLEIEIGGATPGSEYDQVNHTLGVGAAQLGGELEVVFLDGFESQVDLADSFTVLTAMKLTGGFTNVASGERLDLAGGGSFRVEYDGLSDEVVLSHYQATPFLPGDYNSDGVVDAADYTVWRSNLGAPAATLTNDADGGPIGTNQYLTWQANYGATLPTALGAAPEPATFAMGTLVVAVFVGARRSRDAS